MAKKKSARSLSAAAANRAFSSVDELLLAAMERGDDSLETGRYLVTFKESAVEEGLQSFEDQGMRVADARDFEDQAATLESLGDADAVLFPEIGVALLGSDAAEARGLSVNSEMTADSPIEAIEPEYFAFAQEERSGSLGGGIGRTTQVDTSDYLLGFARAAQVIAGDLGATDQEEFAVDEDPLVVGATWGLIKCRVPPSVRSGIGIRVAVLDTGMCMGHPDFAGRPIVGATFVGQPVQDLHGHGTHLIGTSCGPKAPPGTTPRYGIAYRAPIFAGKVLSNSGSGTTGGILAGMNWAIANRCPAILLGFGSASPVQAAYTAAGNAALSKGCLMIAPAGSAASGVGAPANSPTVMSVASLEPNLTPSSFSNVGKIDIAAPGRDVFSAVCPPIRYAIKSGTSPAAAHVAGCAALWADSSPGLRGIALWRRLQASARRLPFPPARVGAGLVQAP